MDIAAAAAEIVAVDFVAARQVAGDKLYLGAVAFGAQQL